MRPLPPAEPPRPPRPPREPIRLPQIDGATALALVGGVVMLLGIVFFFVLAVNAGWVGPLGRVALGGGASLAIFLAGFELRRRFGATSAALAAAGVGIAGGYATLLAAAALYDLLPGPAALFAAAAIAGIGLATSIAWNSQIVAGMGLIGAMLVPLAVVAQGGLSTIGTAFVAVVLAAGSAVTLWKRWSVLLGAAALVSMPQIVALVALDENRGHAPWRIVLVAAAFTAVYLATGIAEHLRSGEPGIGQTATTFLIGSAALAAGSIVSLYGGIQQEGAAFLVVTGVYGLLAAGFFFRPATRDLSALLAAVGFVLAAVAFADLLSGRPLAYAWAAEAAALAWLSRTARELRFQVWSAAYLVLALGHTLILDAPPTRLFVPDAHPAAGAPAVVACALAAAAFGLYARPWTETFVDRGGLYGLLAGFFTGFQARHRLLRDTTLWLAGALATFAVSLWTLAAFSSPSRGWVALAGLWSLIGLAILAAGLRLASTRLRAGALSWLGVATAAVVLHGEALEATPRSWALLVLAAALLVAALGNQLGDRLGTWPLDASGAAAAGAAVLGAFAADGLLGGQPLALAFAGTAAALALLAWRAQAPHFQTVSIAYLGLGLGHVLAFDAPVQDLFVAGRDPARGALTVGVVALAATVFGVGARPWTTAPDYADLEPLLAPFGEDVRMLRSIALWLAGVVGTYAVSLAMLSLFSSFDWGHVALAGLWSLIGVALVGVGIRRGSQLCEGGLVWLAIVFAILVEHASSLAATPRAWSFVVLGAALLAAGIDYQLRSQRPAVALPVSAALVVTSLGLGLAAQAWLVDGDGLHGAALIDLAAIYGALAAVVFRKEGQRPLRTLLWVIALTLAAVAAGFLLDGTLLVLAWAAGGAAAAWLSDRMREPLFLIGSGAYLALALGHAVGLDAPPQDLFTTSPHPASGAPAILIVALLLPVFAHYLRAAGRTEIDDRGVAWWLAGVLAVYGISLSILELAQQLFPGQSLDTSFQRGHTGVSAFWGLLGLVLLYAGLTRWRGLRVAGFALFAVSLAKIFLYDLPSLSSVTRALSFLVVGGVLLLGGFFYQRLASTSEPVG